MLYHFSRQIGDDKFNDGSTEKDDLNEVLAFLSENFGDSVVVVYHDNEPGQFPPFVIDWEKDPLPIETPEVGDADESFASRVRRMITILRTYDD